MTRWQVEADAAAVADAACHRIAQTAAQAIAARGAFHLVLAGGQTPLAAYRRLAVSDQQWPAWTLYYGDERCLPVDHPERNSQLVADTGLAGRVGQHLVIPTERGCDVAAAAYGEVIAAIDRFDLVVLGIGEDGHTASLFPGHDWPDRPVFAIDDSPKPPAARVSLAVGTLQRSRAILVMVSGANKRAAVGQWRAGVPLPISAVTTGETDVIIARESLPPAQDRPSAADASEGAG